MEKTAFRGSQHENRVDGSLNAGNQQNTHQLARPRNLLSQLMLVRSGFSCGSVVRQDLYLSCVADTAAASCGRMGLGGLDRDGEGSGMGSSLSRDHAQIMACGLLSIEHPWILLAIWHSFHLNRLGPRLVLTQTGESLRLGVPRCPRTR